MKIKFVEELVGITRKNIRFYEEQGLLSPKRAENGYREYGQEDVERLRQIKLLRKLGVPLEEIRRVLRGDVRLEDCLDRQLDELERQKENMTKMQAVGRQIAASHVTLAKLDTEGYLERVEKIEKEGTRFMDIERTDVTRKKKMGAVIAAAVIVLFAALVIALMLWANGQDPIPRGILAVVILIPIVMGVSAVAVLVGRIRELEGGEENEASKY